MRTILALLLATTCQAASFDLRDLGAVTPIRSQMVANVDSSECWAFAAAAMLETDYQLSTGQQVVLSPEYIRDTLVATTDLMPDAIRTTVVQGTVLDAVCPVIGDQRQNTPPALTAPYTIYRASSFTQLPDDLASLKAFLVQHGAITTEITNAIYRRVWDTSTGGYLGVEWAPEWSIFGNHPVMDQVHNLSYIEYHPELHQRWDMDYPFMWHVLVIVGWYDDVSWPGGGYFVVKSSYPTSVGPWQDGAGGFGYISYAAMLNLGTMGTTSTGLDRRFFGLDGPAGSLTHDAGGVSVLGTFIANYQDIPSGSNLSVGLFPQTEGVPEPCGSWLVLAALPVVYLALSGER